MLNFASLFNQWRTTNNNGLIELIAQPNISMGRILEEESFLQEYKAGSSRITQFLKYDRYEELIEYVTVVGPADDKKRSYKYPLAACEVLSTDTVQSIGMFFPEKPIVIQNKYEETIEVEEQIEVQMSPEEIALEAQKQGKSSRYEEKVTEEEKIQAKAEQTQESKEQKVKEISTENKSGDEVEILQQTPSEENKIQQSKEDSPQKLAPVQVEQESPNKPKQSSEVPQKKMKKVMKKVTKTVQRVEEKEMPPLIDKLLSYFQGEVNYTLAGYVCKILNTLLKCKPEQLTKRVLTEKTRNNILNHAQSRSVGEFIFKILTQQNEFSMKQRHPMFGQLIDRISVPSEVPVISNLSVCICQIIEKVANDLKSQDKVYQLQGPFNLFGIINKILNNMLKDEEVVVIYNAPVVYTYVTNLFVSLILPNTQEEQADFINLIKEFVIKCSEKLVLDNKTTPKLGYGRLKIIEILRYMIQQNIIYTRSIVAKIPNFFFNLFNLMKQYPMNNLLHNQIMKIVKVATEDTQNSQLNSSILQDDVLINFIKSQWQEDSKIKAGESVYKYRKGYIAHVINLCVKLKELSRKNDNIKALTEGRIFTQLYEKNVQKEIFNSKKSLAGLIKRFSQGKLEILFQKEDIIAAHMTFLQKCPSPVFDVPEAPPEPNNIDSPDLVEELQRQLEENMHIKSGAETEKSKPVVESQTQQAESSAPKTDTVEEKKQEMEKNLESEGRFWATHLEYNIDDLMAEL